MLIIIFLFLLFLFLIVFGFTLLAYIPQTRQFLLRNPKPRRVGLFLLAIFSFLTGLLFSSRFIAEAQFALVETVYNTSTQYWPFYVPSDWNLIIQNKSSILNELWIKILFPFLSGGRCPYSPELCSSLNFFLELDWTLYAFIYISALIPTFITLVLGWLFTRKNRVPTANQLQHRPRTGDQTP